MLVLAIILAIVLFFLSALHAYWGFGGVWPGKDGQSCVRIIAGFKGITEMPPPAAGFAVAGALSVTAISALISAGVLPSPFPSRVPFIVTLGASSVFLGRGIAGYTPAWRRLTPEEPFATLDIRFYSPLCLGIGLALLLIVFG